MILSRPQAYPSWIEVTGFKSIKNRARIDIRPLTLLAGANSSGKSSMLQPLLLLKQSLEVSYEPDTLLLDGGHLEFTSLNQFLSKGRSQNTRVEKFEVAFGESVIPSSFDEGLPLPFPFTTRKNMEVKLIFRRRQKKEDHLESTTQVRSTGTTKWIPVSQKSKSAIMKMMELDEDQARYFVSTGQIYTEVDAVAMKEEGTPELERLGTSTPLRWVQGILHLPGYRGHRDRRYPVAKVMNDRNGGFSVRGPMHPYTASLLRDWNEVQKDPDSSENAKAQAKENLSQVNDGLRMLGLTWKVLSASADAAKLELRVGRVPKPQRGGAQDLVDIADVGFGLSQVLPVLVALAAAQPGQMVLIEQPELHLHPKAQLAMGAVLAAAAERGVIVVVETHSQLILRAIQTVVASDGGLSADQVGLHWFTRDPDTGWSTVKRADLHDDGTFGDWPVDFPDVFAMADEQFIDAVFARQEEQ